MEREPLWKALVRLVPAVGWYAVIWYLSSQTGDESQAVSDGVLEAMGYDIKNALMSTSAFLSFLVRKGAHMFAFFALTGLLAFALWRLVKRPAFRGALALALCGLLAGLDEFHQTFVPGRSGTLRDVGVDLLGGVCFLLLWALAGLVLAKKRKNSANRRSSLDKTGNFL